MTVTWKQLSFADHDHDAAYVNVSGDTMTDALLITKTVVGVFEGLSLQNTHATATNDGTRLSFKESSGVAVGLITSKWDGANWILDIGTNDLPSTLRIKNGLTTSYGSMAVDPGQYLRFPHANQTDGHDGKIGAGLFSEGLNIVGVQTVAAAGRKIYAYGRLTLNDSPLKMAGLELQSTALDNFTLMTAKNDPNPNWNIGYGNDAGLLDTTLEYISANAGIFKFHNATVLLNNAAGTYRLLGMTSANYLRWQFGTDGGAESGSDAGSNWNIYRYSDAGEFLGAPFSIRRSDGAAYFTSDAADALRVQSGGGTPVLTVDTSNNYVNFVSHMQGVGVDGTSFRFYNTTHNTGAVAATTYSEGAHLHYGPNFGGYNNAARIHIGYDMSATDRAIVLGDGGTYKTLVCIADDLKVDGELSIGLATLGNKLHALGSYGEVFYFECHTSGTTPVTVRTGIVSAILHVVIMDSGDITYSESAMVELPSINSFSSVITPNAQQITFYLSNGSDGHTSRDLWLVRTGGTHDIHVVLWVTAGR